MRGGNKTTSILESLVLLGAVGVLSSDESCLPFKTFLATLLNAQKRTEAEGILSEIRESKPRATDNDFLNKNLPPIDFDIVRMYVQPREDWKKKLRRDGVTYHSKPGAFNPETGDTRPFWNEESCIEVNCKGEINLIEYTYQLHSMCLEAVEMVVQDDVLLEIFEIPRHLWPAIRKSWKDKQPDFIGRMDFSWDGQSAPKLLEYNADTPSLLIESGKAQKNWCNEKFPDDYQCNFIDPALRNAIRRVGVKSRLLNDGYAIGIGMMMADKESSALAEYLRQVIKFNDIEAFTADMSDLSFQYIFPNTEKENSDGTVSHAMFKLGCRSIGALVKLYPYEWIYEEAEDKEMLGENLEDVHTIEPAWKLILSNKALLPLLYEMFPTHPCILPAYFEDPRKSLESLNEATHRPRLMARDASIEHWVSKPKFGRKGEGVLLGSQFHSYSDFITASQMRASQNRAGVITGSSIYQQQCNLPKIDGMHIATSSWVIGGQPAGFCFRESSDYIPGSKYSFIPHLVTRNWKLRHFKFKHTPRQLVIRKEVYAETAPNYIYGEGAHPDEHFVQWRVDTGETDPEGKLESLMKLPTGAMSPAMRALYAKAQEKVRNQLYPKKLSPQALAKKRRQFINASTRVNPNRAASFGKTYNRMNKSQPPAKQVSKPRPNVEPKWRKPLTRFK